MKRGSVLLLAGLVSIAAFLEVASAQNSPPPCPPGYKYVEETVMKEEVRFCCKVVPHMKKKWVYDCRQDAFCMPHNPCTVSPRPEKEGHCGNPHCAQCQTGQPCFNCNLYYRKLLVKKQIEYCVGQKCQVERIVEMVPCRTWNMVPINPEPILAPKGFPSTK